MVYWYNKSFSATQHIFLHTRAQNIFNSGPDITFKLNLAVNRAARSYLGEASSIVHVLCMEIHLHKNLQLFQ